MGRPPAGTFEEPTPVRLTRAARAAFAGGGFEGARLADIAAEAGVRRPSLLYHFPTKEALYAATVRESFEEIGRALAGAIRGEGDFEGRVDALVAALRDFLDGNPEVARLILREVLDDRGPGHALLVGEVGPLLGVVEDFLAREGGDRLRPGPHRPGLMQLAVNMLVRAAAGPLRPELWGTEDGDEALARALLLEDRS